MNQRVRKPGRKGHEAATYVRQNLVRVVGLSAHIIVWAALASVLVQLLWPGGRSLPLATVDGRDMGNITRDQAMDRLEVAAADATLTIATPAREHEVQWATAGVTIDRAATAEVLVSYEWWERLVPFSMLVRMAQHDHAPIVIVDQERLGAFAEKVSTENQRAAVEASITIKEGRVQVDKAKAGVRFDAEEIERRIIATPFASGATVGLQPEIVPAARDRQAAADTAQKARQVLEREVLLEFASQTFKPDRATIGSWLDIVENQKTKKLEVRIGKEALNAYLDGINKQHASPPGTVVVTLLDGREVKRTDAQAGRAMNTEKTAAQVEKVLFGSGSATIAVPIETIPPEVAYRRTYSRQSAGLQAIIEEWERTTYGEYGIIVREIGGQNRYAQWQPNKPFVTASTYKMFLAYTVFVKMQDGVIDGGQRTDMGWTVDECLTEMIVNSTNPCAISLQNMVGWAEVDRMLHAAGFNDTDLNNLNGGDKYTTVRDEADFLRRLHAGTLMSSESTGRLLGLMKRQIWRGGIPAGVPAGTTVADKVGFYNGWVHDVAIVYAPKSTYILAIMSRGGSDPAFADLSERVYDFFNQ